RQHHFLAEDPRADVDDDEAVADVIRGVVDLADATVESLDREAGEIALRDGRIRIRPEITRGHCGPLSACLVQVQYPTPARHNTCKRRLFSCARAVPS